MDARRFGFEGRDFPEARGCGPRGGFGPEARLRAARFGPGGFAPGVPGGFGPGARRGHGFGPEARLRAGGFGHGFGPGFGGPGFGPGFGGPGGFDPRAFGGRRGGRGRGRQRRGDVRAAVLALLAERPMHGYEMIREIAERSQGAWRPSPGSVYPLLQQLADEELVTEAEEGRGAKRRYRLTEQGRAEAAKHTTNPPWEQAAADVTPEDETLHKALRAFGGAAMQLGAMGTTDQKARAARVLGEARKKLYAILAEDLDTDSDDAGDGFDAREREIDDPDGEDDDGR